MKRKKGLLSSLLGMQRKRLMLLSGVSILLGGVIISQGALFAEVVQRILVHRVTFREVLIPLSILLAIMGLRSLLSYLNGRIGLAMAADAKTTMRWAVLRKLADNPLLLALGGQTGGKVSLALDAVDETDSYFSQYMPRMLEALFAPLMILIVVFGQHTNSGIIMLCTAPFIPLFMALVGIQTKHQSEDKVAQLAAFSGVFLDAFQGLVTLKIFGKVKQQEQEIEKSSIGFREATMGILRIAFTNSFMLELIVMLSIGLIALELALQLLVYKAMAFHTALFVFILVPEFYAMLRNMGSAFHSGRTSMGAARKIEELTGDLTEQVKMIQQEEQLPEATASAAVGSASPTSPSEPLAPPTIALQQVQFEYGSSAFAVTAGEIAIAPGEHIAIIGKSGAGKTTLLHLLSGLLKPQTGELMIDDKPLSQEGEEAWFRQVSYITQHPYIFAGTLSDNIAIGANFAPTESEIMQAAEDAGLSDLIAELEHGIHTPVGEGGRGLSGGEQQRLALARAFLNKPSVIFFDEPTVGLDLRTEQLLQQSIKRLAEGATMITVAHRLHTIRSSDRILFLQNGEIAGSGRHEELLDQLPQYAEMVSVWREGGFA